MFCGHCGSANADDGKFCVTCRGSISGLPAAPATTGSAAASPAQPSTGTRRSRRQTVKILICVSLFSFLLLILIVIPHRTCGCNTAANEASAVGTLRTMKTAAVTYQSTYDNGFPPDQASFGGLDPGTCNAANLMDNTISVNGGAQKSGYTITYVATPSTTLSDDAKRHGCTSPGALAYEIHADPITRNTKGNRSFFTDQTGVVRATTEDVATADSEPLH